MKIDQNYRGAKRPKITRIYWSYMTLLSVKKETNVLYLFAAHFPSLFSVINLSFLGNMEHCCLNTFTAF